MMFATMPRWLLSILLLCQFFCGCSSRYSLSDKYYGTTREISAQYISGDSAKGSLEIQDHNVRIYFSPWPLGKLHGTDLGDNYSEIVIDQDRFYCIPKPNSFPPTIDVYVLTHDGLLKKVDSIFWRQ
jgi:hypothetical protein